MESIELIVSKIKEWCIVNKLLINSINPNVISVDLDIDIPLIMEALESLVINGEMEKYLLIECPSCYEEKYIEVNLINEKTQCDNCKKVFTPEKYVDTSCFIGFRYSTENKFIDNNSFNPLEYIKPYKKDNIILLNEEDKYMKKNINKKIFISHCSHNLQISDAIVNLLENIGVNSSDIYYSSYEDTGAELLDDCLDSIVDEFNNNDLLVIFLISREFYNSDICLAEAGATWVTVGENYIPIILPPYGYDNLGGVIRSSKNSIQLNDSKLSSKIEHFKETIEDFIGIQKKVTGSTWDRKKNIFMDIVSKYIESINDIEALLKEVDLIRGKIVFRIAIKNNTKIRKRVSDIKIKLSMIKSSDIIIDINDELVEALVIKPLESIDIYLSKTISDDIRRSNISLEECTVEVSSYNQE